MHGIKWPTTYIDLNTPLYSRFYNEADQAAMWLINCKEVSQQSDTCKQHKYWGSMDLRSMAKFIKVIEKPLIVSSRIRISMFENENYKCQNDNSQFQMSRRQYIGSECQQLSVRITIVSFRMTVVSSAISERSSCHIKYFLGI